MHCLYITNHRSLGLVFLSVLTVLGPRRPLCLPFPSKKKRTPIGRGMCGTPEAHPYQIISALNCLHSHKFLQELFGIPSCTRCDLARKWFWHPIQKKKARVFPSTLAQRKDDVAFTHEAPEWPVKRSGTSIGFPFLSISGEMSNNERRHRAVR